MDHFLSDGETVPYYQFINEKLLEIAKSEIIVELLDVNMESKDDFSKHQNKKFNTKCSFVECLTNNRGRNSSAQVSFC